MDNIFHFSAPGRTEIGGNHTDHQHGCVLAAAIDRETTAEVRRNGSNVIRVVSEGYAPVEIALENLMVRENEKNTTAALVRGVAAAFAGRGIPLGGFEAEVRSTVLPGSGLSSSAVFEVLMGRILNGLFADGALSAVEIAQIGQYAENVYYGKPSGLMDQMASSVGGLVFIDFADPQSPLVEKAVFDFTHSGYTLCTVDSGADHADLTEEYAAIPREMGAVAAFFGKDVLREVDEAELFARLAEVRGAVGDRAVLRAIHFFEENARVRWQLQALQEGRFHDFLRGVNESGTASWTLLQNVIPAGAARRQDMGLTLALCRRLLGGEGAVRVHGGGFAGTALAFVPLERFPAFQRGIEAVLGKGRCQPLAIQS